MTCLEPFLSAIYLLWLELRPAAGLPSCSDHGEAGQAPELAGSGGGQWGQSPCRGGPPVAPGKVQEFVLCLL